MDGLIAKRCALLGLAPPLGFSSMTFVGHRVGRGGGLHAHAHNNDQESNVTLQGVYVLKEEEEERYVDPMSATVGGEPLSASYRHTQESSPRTRQMASEWP
jgi:hypothetical protein